jgi:hypothetical protein
MSIGGFLDSFPSVVFIAAHVLFLVVGYWAMRRAAAAGQPFSSAFWLYIVSQIGFLAFFGGVLTLKMAVLIEQTLLLIFVILLVRRPVAAHP